MRKDIGEKSLSIWLEFLSIADQNEGTIPGDLDLLIRSVSGTCQVTVSTVRAVYEHALSKVWLKCQPTLHVVKYWNYHKAREPIRFPPDLPNLPDLPKEKNKNKREPVHISSAVPVETQVRHRESLTLPDWLPAETWKNFKEHRVRLRKPLTRHAEELAIARLAHFRAEGHDPVEIVDAAILGGWQGLYIPREDKNGRQKSAEPKGFAGIREILGKNRA